MTNELTPPLPVATPVSEPFWQGLQEQEIRLQRCLPCEKWVYYPRSCCPICLGRDLQWQVVKGEATLYTYTLARQPTAPHFANDAPQNIAVVELAVGVRLTTTLVNVPEDSIRIGMQLRPVFDQVDAQTTLLRYEGVS